MVFVCVKERFDIWGRRIRCPEALPILAFSCSSGILIQRPGRGPCDRAVMIFLTWKTFPCVGRGGDERGSVDEISV